MLWLCACVACLLTGCDTVGQDLSDLSSAFNSTTPREAADDMVDQFDADRRRNGTVLISNATFGGAEPYVKEYRFMVDNERDPIVKAVAIRALARHGAPEDAMRILPHLTHENVQVRWEAAKGLQRLHNDAAVSDLLRVLANENERPDVRVAAAVALGQYPEDRVFHGLLAALNTRELAINTAAANSLATLTGQTFGLDAPAWFAWYSGSVASNGVFADQQEYLYPTYSREETIWEKLAFWSTLQFEQPGPPAGLRPESERGTYDDVPGSEPGITGG